MADEAEDLLAQRAPRPERQARPQEGEPPAAAETRPEASQDDPERDPAFDTSGNESGTSPAVREPEAEDGSAGNVGRPGRRMLQFRRSAAGRNGTAGDGDSEALVSTAPWAGLMSSMRVYV